MRYRSKAEQNCFVRKTLARADDHHRNHGGIYAKDWICICCFGAFGLVLPLSAPAKAEGAAIVIKNGDRDRDHDRRWHRDHHKVAVVIKHRHKDNGHDHD